MSILKMMMEKQELVGYTIVGSLTESPSGVFSGFSDSNYLETSQIFPNDLAYDDCEYQVKFTLPASISYDQQIIFTFFRGTSDGIRVTTGGRLRCFFGGSNNILNSPTSYLAFGNTYVVRFINRNNKLSLYCGADENNLQLVVSQDKVSFTNNSPLPVRIGSNQVTNNYFSGSIDLSNNNSYIKIKRKLWFNGQEG